MLTEQSAASPSVEMDIAAPIYDAATAALTPDEEHAIQEELRRAELALNTLQRTLNLAQLHLDDAHLELLADAWEHLRDPMITLGIECRCTVDGCD